MSDSELLFFPRGQVSIDGLNPQQVTDFSYEFVNGAKLKSTLRSNPAGFTLGTKAVSGDFNIIVDEDGEEIDYDGAVDSGEVFQTVAKFPGGVNKTILMVLTSAGAKFTIDDGVARSLKFIGKLILPAG